MRLIIECPSNHFVFHVLLTILDFSSVSFSVGWEDAPLADEGIEEAKEAGRNLKKNGFEYVILHFDCFLVFSVSFLHGSDEISTFGLKLDSFLKLSDLTWYTLRGLVEPSKRLGM